MEMPVHREKRAESHLQNWLAQCKCYSLCRVNSKEDFGPREEDWGAVCLNCSNLEVLIWSLMAKGKCLWKRLVALVHSPLRSRSHGSPQGCLCSFVGHRAPHRCRTSTAAGWEAQLRAGAALELRQLFANEWIHHRFACVLPAGRFFSSCADAASSDLSESPNYSAFNENWSFANHILIWEQGGPVTISGGLLP